MYGGIKYKSLSGFPAYYINKQTTNELWSFNLETNKWTLMNQPAHNESSSSNQPLNNQTQSNQTIYQIKNYELPSPVSGHSMYLVKKSLLIFFGYSEYYGSNLNLIQEFRFGKFYFLFKKIPSALFHFLRSM